MNKTTSKSKTYYVITDGKKEEEFKSYKDAQLYKYIFLKDKPDYKIYKKQIITKTTLME